MGREYEEEGAPIDAIGWEEPIMAGDWSRQMIFFNCLWCEVQFHEVGNVGVSQHKRLKCITKKEPNKIFWKYKLAKNTRSHFQLIDLVVL